ncbi:anti-sigma factor family protein [candidate division KSB1 bacterium]
MKCNLTEEKLLDYFYDELTGKDREEFEKHMETCPVCAEELKALQLTSRTMQTWEVPERKMNIIFVAEKGSLKERIKDAPDVVIRFLAQKPVKSFVFSVAAVFLLLSFTNFNARYDGESGSISLSSSVFGILQEEPDINEAMTQQIIQTQNQILELVNQIIIEYDQTRQEQTYSLVGQLLHEYNQSAQYQRVQDLQTMGLTLMQLQELTNQNYQTINNTRAIVYDVAQTAGIEIKR